MMVSFYQLGFAVARETITPRTDTTREILAFAAGIGTGLLGPRGVKEAKKYVDEKKWRRLPAAQMENGRREVNKKIEAYEELFNILPNRILSVQGFANTNLENLSSTLSKWYLHSVGIITMSKESQEHYKKLQEQLGNFHKQNSHEGSESMTNTEINKIRKGIIEEVVEFKNSLRKDLCLE